MMLKNNSTCKDSCKMSQQHAFWSQRLLERYERCCQLKGSLMSLLQRSQCGHHLWPSHDSPLASCSPHKLLVDSWICCRFQWHWQRRILVQRKHASKYRPQPNLSTQAAFGATRMCLNVYLFFNPCFLHIMLSKSDLRSRALSR